MKTVEYLIEKLKTMPLGAKVAILDISIDNQDAVFSDFEIEVIPSGINDDTDESYPEWVAISFNHERE